MVISGEVGYLFVVVGSFCCIVWVGVMVDDDIVVLCVLLVVSDEDVSLICIWFLKELENVE